tara:strand:+ start:112 stop:660 length:549 start_codon:yes stop_codon:yes gene_type:complete
MNLEVVDNFLPRDKHLKAFGFVKNAPARWGEYDDLPEKPAGSSIHIKKEDQIFQYFDKVARDRFDQLNDPGFDLVRMYVNVFWPHECPRWHIDAHPIEGLESYTVLYYPHLDWDRNDGGFTHFWKTDHTIGHFPMPNRAICFDGTIWHTATAFTDQIRYTYALKYEKCTGDIDVRQFGSARS